MRFPAPRWLRDLLDVQIKQKQIDTLLPQIARDGHHIEQLRVAMQEAVALLAFTEDKAAVEARGRLETALARKV